MENNKKCENCIHENVCGFYFGLTKETVADNLNCIFYKDKSLCVELPCKVGDTVYEIRDPKIFNEKIVEMRVIAITFLVSSCCKHLSITVENSREANLLFELDDFGKTVFLDRAEAEAKLKKLGV